MLCNAAMAEMPLPCVAKVGEDEARFLGASCTALSAAIALAAIGTRSEGFLRHAGLAMMTILALHGAWVALLSGIRAIGRWGRLQRQADVQRALKALGSAYRVIAMPGNVDRHGHHVVVGPNGVFVIVSCDDAGRVTASERRLFVDASQPLRNLLEECHIVAVRAGEAIRRRLGHPVSVHGVLCFTRALVVVGYEVRGIKTAQVHRLARLIASVAATQVMSPADVEAAAAALAESAPGNDGARRTVSAPKRLRAVSAGERVLTLVPRPVVPRQGTL